MNTPPDTQHPARIRSYVLRQGRISDARKQALERLWPRYGLSAQSPVVAARVFGREAPLHLEIGFGMGNALLEMARAHPENDYLGVEVHLPGVARLLAEAEKLELSNLRVLRRDAVQVLREQIADASLEAIYLFFPDPWPKKRHHKRRLVQTEFAREVTRALKPGGLFHLATDWEDYALHSLAVLEDLPGLINQAGPGGFSPRPPQRPLTKFEQRGQRLGHGIWDLLYRKGYPFKAGQMPEDGGQRTEDRGRRTEDGGQRTEDGGRRTEDGGRRTEDGWMKSNSPGGAPPGYRYRTPLGFGGYQPQQRFASPEPFGVFRDFRGSFQMVPP